MWLALSSSVTIAIIDVALASTILYPSTLILCLAAIYAAQARFNYACIAAVIGACVTGAFSVAAGFMVLTAACILIGALYATQRVLTHSYLALFIGVVAGVTVARLSLSLGGLLIGISWRGWGEGLMLEAVILFVCSLCSRIYVQHSAYAH